MDKVDADNWHFLLAEWRRVDHNFAWFESKGYKLILSLQPPPADGDHSPQVLWGPGAGTLTIEVTSERLAEWAGLIWNWN